MSILNRKGVPLTEENELAIWEMVGKPYNFPGGLALVLLRHGFHVAYFQDFPELLSATNPEFEAMDKRLLSAANTYVELHQAAVMAGLEFKVTDWNFQTVRREITRGNICIIYLHVTNTVTHVVLAHGVKGSRLEIMDPLRSIRYLSEDEFDARIVNPMGKRLLVVKKLPDDLFDVLNDKLALLGY